MKKLILMIAAALTGMAEAEIVEEVQIDGLVYSLDTEAKTATLTANWTQLSSIDVSSVTKDNQVYAVVSVGYGALKDCESLTSVSLPNVTTIGNSAFTGLKRLVSISLPKAILIGKNAFSACPISSITLPCATTISEGAFYDCPSLASVLLPKANEIGYGAFKSCASLTDVSLPNATKVGEYAFEDSGITSISLPNAAMIDKYAFYNTHSLTNVSLPKAMTIAEGAFCYTALSSLSLPEATDVGTAAFWGCSSLISVALPSATEIGYAAFEGCSKLTAIGVSPDVKAYLEQNREYCSVGKDVEIKVIPKFTEEQTRDVAWNAKITSDNIVLMLGDKIVSENDYDFACEFYGIAPKSKRSVDDFKVVDKDTPVVGSDEVAVKKIEIRAATAETVKVENGNVTICVNVCSNGNVQAETKDWKPVNLTSENVSVVNGKVVISIPVNSQSGFMILQTGDAKIGAGD